MYKKANNLADTHMHTQAQTHVHWQMESCQKNTKLYCATEGQNEPRIQLENKEKKGICWTTIFRMWTGGYNDPISWSRSDSATTWHSKSGFPAPLRDFNQRLEFDNTMIYIYIADDK